MIVLSNVVHHYGVRPVLKGVSIKVDRGEIIAVLGPNGMGKSTLLGVMAGILSPQFGKVEIDGQIRRGSVEGEQEIRRKTFYLPDQPWLPAMRTGREFLLGVGRVYGIEDFRLMDHVNRLLDLFDLSDKGDQPIRSYSAGQRKKIAISSALVAETPILLLDEPFSGGLDPAGLLAIKRVLQQHPKRKDMMIVLTSPVPEIVEELASKVAVVRDGQLIAFDTVDGLRKEFGCRGSLSDVLEKIMFPETVAKIQSYFQEVKNPGAGFGDGLS